MLTNRAAQDFATSWYKAWNAHDLDAIMAHYAEGIEHSSPFIARYNQTAEPTLRGKDAVRAYFGRALKANPTLSFHPHRLALGVETVVLMYTRMTGDFAAEMFAFGAEGSPDAGKVVRSVSHYDLGG